MGSAVPVRQWAFKINGKLNFEPQREKKKNSIHELIWPMLFNKMRTITWRSTGQFSQFLTQIRRRCGQCQISSRGEKKYAIAWSCSKSHRGIINFDNMIKISPIYFYLFFACSCISTNCTSEIAIIFFSLSEENCINDLNFTWNIHSHSKMNLKRNHQTEKRMWKRNYDNEKLGIAYHCRCVRDRRENIMKRTEFLGALS